MKPEDRRRGIMETLVAESSARLDALARRFAVSEMTIHRDLDELEAQGLLRKIRGGATIEASGMFESDHRYRARLAEDEKRDIAARAAQFVTPGMSILLDDGSTAQALVPFLIEKQPLTVITNGLSLQSALAGARGIDVVALGGTYVPKFDGFFGVLTERMIDGLRADAVFLSSSAIDGHWAFHQNQEVMAVKQRMLAASAKRYLMADAAKFGRTALHVFADLTEFDAVVTSPELAAETVSALQADGVTIVRSEGEAR